MAELPKYRRAGVLTAGIGRINPVGDREAIETTGLLAQKLDRMSQWAFGEAMDQAKEQGLQYGAENPVTLQQLRDAVTAGLPPERLFQKKGTAFGDAARAMQIAAVTSDVELDAQTRLNNLKLGVERGDVELADAQKEIQAMLDGYGQTMAGVDPKASLKLRASLGTASNSAFLAMSKSYVQRAQDLKKTALESWLANTLPDQARTHFEAGDTSDPESGKLIPARQRVDATLRRVLLEQLADIGDPDFARQALTKFGSTISKAQIDAVTVYVTRDPFMRDPSAGLAKIRAGDLGEYSATFAGMSESDREAVRRNFMEEAGRIHVTAERLERDQKEQQRRIVYDLLAQYHASPNTADKARLRNEIVGAGRDVLTIDQLRTLLRPSGDGKDNITAEIRAIDLIRRGGVTDLAELQRRSPGLQPSQLKRLQDMIYDAGDRELREGIRTMAGIPDGLVQLNGDQQRRYQALTDAANRFRSEQIAKGGIYDPRSVLGRLREEREALTRDNVADSARAALEGYGRQRGVSIDENTPESELTRLRYTAAEIREIQRRQRELKGR